MTQQIVERYGDHIFNHAAASEDERLGALAAELDPVTFRRLGSLPVQRDWRCLELGAGTGSVARWMADRCPEGGVVATDLDLELVRRNDGDAGVTWTHHDLTRDEFPPGSFDLIHARYLFCHLRSRDTDLARVMRWLTPGGWLVLEEPARFPIDASPDHAYRTTGMGVFAALAERIGTDCDWPRDLEGHMGRAGLTELDSDVAYSLAGGGRPMGRFWELTVEQLAPVLCEMDGITPDMVADTLVRLRDPNFREPGMATVGVIGRRPVA